MPQTQRADAPAVPIDPIPAYRAEDFLRDRSAPSRLASAEPWGEAALTLDIAGGPYAFTGLDPASQRAAIRRFSPVVRVSSAVEPGSLPTDVRRLDPAVFRPVPHPLFAFELTQTNRPDGIDLLGWRLVARLGLAGGLSGTLGLARSADLIGMGELENYLRFLAAYSLLGSGGLLMHSACVLHRREAYLFLGRSGAGKTTLSSLALEAGMQVLSDDMNALMPGTPPSVHRLPFAGTLGQSAGDAGVHPVRAICWLVKGQRVACAPMAASVALARVAACAPYVNTDPFRAARLLDALASLVVKVPVLTLTFPRRADVLRIIEQIGAHAPGIA